MRAAGALKGGLVAALVYFVFAVPMVLATVFITQSTTSTLAANCSTGAGGVGPGGGTQQIGDEQYNGDQLANAQTITSVAVSRALPRRAAVLGIATAMVESGLRNLNYGDRDSLGLFQQRPSQGWGSPEQVLNPTYAAGLFYDHLVRVPGWATMPPGRAEQAVQRSGFPDRYAPREAAAAALAERFWHGPDNPVQGSAQQVDLAAGGCPDAGRSDLPLDRNWNPKALPPGFQPPANPTILAAVTYAVAQVGKPYVWGATGPRAFDCSGLMQAAWAHAGVAISRTTATQIHDGAPVGSLKAVVAGDLLFIPGANGSAVAPGHVGLYAGSGVVVDAYDTNHGVITEQLTAWAPKVVAIRRIVTIDTAPAGDPRA